MTENATIQTAQAMFLHGSGRKEVIEYLLQNGTPETKVDDVATNAYLAIKEQRMQLLNEREDDSSSGVGGSAIFGVLLLLGGIVATMSTDRIWYGAMLVGVVMIIKGFRR